MRSERTGFNLCAAVIAAIGCLSVAVQSAEPGVPVLFWASDPVLPDEAVVVTGEDLGQPATLEAWRIRDAQDSSAPGASRWEPLPALQQDRQSLKFVVPATWRPGVFAIRVRSGARVSETRFVNAPDPWWVQANNGETASPGGWLRVFGKSLCFRGYATLSEAPASRALLRSTGGTEHDLPVTRMSCYALSVPLPEDLECGEYELLVHNGFGGTAGWRQAGPVTVRPASQWPADVFSAAELGVQGALARAKANGGGVVYFPRGRYMVKDQEPLVVPPQTTLRGEGMDLVSLFWPDMEEPPPALITGIAFAIEGLSIYCQGYYRNVIQVPRSSEQFCMRRVRIRANPVFSMKGVLKGDEWRGRVVRSWPWETGKALDLRGRNFEVTDCDILIGMQVAAISGATDGIMARNTFRHGSFALWLSGVDRLIIEDNTITGGSMHSTGCVFDQGVGNFSQNVYVGDNRFSHAYGYDREVFTFDGAGGAYFGTISESAGTRLTLAGDPKGYGFHPNERDSWVGSAVCILEGRGAGQWRRVVSNDGRVWELDRPWAVAPDTQSVITIVPFKGRVLFIGNTVTDGGVVQAYAMSVDCVFAENVFTRADGLLCVGRNPHGYGWQPSWFCQFLGNDIRVGNSWAHRVAPLMAQTTNVEARGAVYWGPLTRCPIMRRNQIRNNGYIAVHGSTYDGLVEHCSVRHSDKGIEIRNTPLRGAPEHVRKARPRRILLRDNVLEHVVKPYSGDALDEACGGAPPQQ